VESKSQTSPTNRCMLLPFRSRFARMVSPLLLSASVITVRYILSDYSVTMLALVSATEVYCLNVISVTACRSHNQTIHRLSQVYCNPTVVSNAISLIRIVATLLLVSKLVSK